MAYIAEVYNKRTLLHNDVYIRGKYALCTQLDDKA